MAARTVHLLLKFIILAAVFSPILTYSRLRNEIRLGVEKELRVLSRLLIRLDHSLAYDDGEVRPNSTQIIRLIEALPELEDDAYLTDHPIGIFSVTRRLAIRWPEILELLKSHKHYKGAFKIRIEELEQFLPGEHNVKEAARNVIQMQRIYGWSVDDVVVGKYPKGLVVSALTCFYLAEAAQDLQEAYYAISWYQKTLQLCESENINDLAVKARSRLAAMYYKVRYLDRAIELAEAIVDADPSNHMVKENLNFYKRIKRDDAFSPPEELKPEQPTKRSQTIGENLCSGKTEKLAESVYKSPLNIEQNWAHITKDNHHANNINKLFLRLVNDKMDDTKSAFTAIFHGSAVRADNLVDLNLIQQHGTSTSTFMVFLNEVDEGGQLIFPYLKIRLRPVRVR